MSYPVVTVSRHAYVPFPRDQVFPKVVVGEREGPRLTPVPTAPIETMQCDARGGSTSRGAGLPGLGLQTPRDERVSGSHDTDHTQSKEGPVGSRSKADSRDRGVGRPLGGPPAGSAIAPPQRIRRTLPGTETHLPRSPPRRRETVAVFIEGATLSMRRWQNLWRGSARGESSTSHDESAWPSTLMPRCSGSGRATGWLLETSGDWLA